MATQLTQRSISGAMQKTVEQTPPVPGSPAAASEAGLPPDSAKMVGSSAEKQRRPIRDLQKQTPQQGQLQTAIRQEQPRKQQTSAEDEARQKAAELQSFGSLGTRVQAIIEQKLKLDDSIKAEGKLKPEKMDSLPPNLKAQAKTLLDNFVANPNDMKALADINNFWAQNSLGDFEPNAWVKTDTAVVADTAAQAIQDTLTLGDIKAQMTPDEQDALQKNFGAGWQQMTVPEMQQALEDLDQAEFSRKSSLEAQLATATGAHRQMLLQELRGLAVTGATGVEASVDKLRAQVARADTVTVNGEMITVEEMLKDDNISDMIARYYLDPKSKFALDMKAQNPELVAWLDKNKDELGAVADKYASQQHTLGEIQDTKAHLNKLGLPDGDSFNDKVMISVLGSQWHDFTDHVPDVSNVGIFKYIQDNANNADALHKFTALLNGSSKETIDYIAHMGADRASDIAHMMSVTSMVDEDRTFYTELYPDADLNGLIVNEDLQKDIAKVDPIVKAIDGDRTGHGSLLKADRDFRDLVKTGQVTSSNIDMLLKDPSSFENWKKYNEWLGEIDTMKSKSGKDLVDGMLDMIFGHDVSIESAQQNMDELYKAKEAMPWSDAAKRYDQMFAVFGNTIDAADGKTLFDRVNEDLGNGTSSFQDALAGSDKIDLDMRDSFKELDKGYVMTADEKYFSETVKELSNTLGPDGKWSSDAFTQMLLDSDNKTVAPVVSGFLTTLFSHYDAFKDKLPFQNKSELETYMIGSSSTAGRSEAFTDYDSDIRQFSPTEERNFSSAVKNLAKNQSALYKMKGPLAADTSATGPLGNTLSILNTQISDANKAIKAANTGKYADQVQRAKQTARIKALREKQAAVTQYLDVAKKWNEWHATNAQPNASGDKTTNALAEVANITALNSSMQR